jgi:hypothetical protein
VKTDRVCHAEKDIKTPPRKKDNLFFWQKIGRKRKLAENFRRGVKNDWSTVFDGCPFLVFYT